MLNGELWLAILAIAGALVLARLWRSAQAHVDRLEAECQALQDKNEHLGASLSKETQIRKRHSEELATLRKKADKAKKRQTRTVDQPLGTTARIRDVEAEMQRVERERDRADSEREALVQQVARLEARLAASARDLEKASAPRPTPVASEAEVSLEQVRAELSTSREQLTKLNEELQLARQTEARMRKRVGNQEQLYASLRAELDVKKDRLRTQEEQLQRLQALKVAVID